MRSGGGKAKGSQFEREVCVMLSKWITSNGREDVFWRSAMSGGRATVAYNRRGKSHASQAGDISCIHPAGQRFINTFAPECKFYANLDYQGLLTGKGKLLAFWAEINLQAKRYDKNPFLIARQNRMQPTVCLSKGGMRELDLRDKETLLISIQNDLFILDAKHFLTVCKPYK